MYGTDRFRLNRAHWVLDTLRITCQENETLHRSNVGGGGGFHVMYFTTELTLLTFSNGWNTAQWDGDESQTMLGRKATNTGYTQKNCAVSKVNKKFISHLTRAQHTLSAAATVQVSHVLITVLQYVHPGSHDTHPHGNQIHPRLGVACPLLWSAVHALSDHEVPWGTWAMVVRKRCL